VIYSDGTTILGGDDKSGVAVILETIRSVQEEQLPHPPLEVVISVGEEVTLHGAKGAGQEQAPLGVEDMCWTPAGRSALS